MKRLAYYALRDVPHAGIMFNDVIILREDGIWVAREVAGETYAWEVPVTLAFALWQEPFVFTPMHEEHPNWVDFDPTYRPKLTVHTNPKPKPCRQKTRPALRLVRGPS